MRKKEEGADINPTKADLAAARDKTVPDVIKRGLKVLFAGINPGLYTAAIGHHFGRPGNRFWPALHAGGFTDRILTPYEEQALLSHGCGITNVVMRATAAADELTDGDFRAGGRLLEKKILTYRPRFLAVLGIGAYQKAFARRRVAIGPQDHRIGTTRVWILPNPSGLNANYQAKDFARLFSDLRKAADQP